MPKEVDGKTYLNTQEAREFFANASPERFNENIKPHLHVYQFNGRKIPKYYALEECRELARGNLIGRPPIVISGLLKNWQEYVRAVGLHAETVTNVIEERVYLADETALIEFHLEAELPMLRRERMTFVQRTPICVWSSYYPMPLVAQFLLDIKHDLDFDIVKAVQEQRGIKIIKATDRLTAHLATQFQQEILQLSRPEPILRLQRAAYSEAGNIVIYSDMALLSQWFAPSYSYSVSVES